jgi:hypothetical protein
MVANRDEESIENERLEMKNRIRLKRKMDKQKSKKRKSKRRWDDEDY